MTDLEQRLEYAKALLLRWDRCACQSGPPDDPRLCLKAKQHTEDHDWSELSRVVHIVPF